MTIKSIDSLKGVSTWFNASVPPLLLTVKSPIFVNPAVEVKVTLPLTGAELVQPAMEPEKVPKLFDGIMPLGPMLAKEFAKSVELTDGIVAMKVSPPMVID